ncbi:MAG: TonB-dependent receptor [Prevotella sp.]|nr:TonB-dependent receptor [Prevotella sp.]MDD4533903.1 TonB-dependent receptor [Prevotella sp.]
MKYKLLLLFLAIFMAQSSFAQTQTVKGTVVDQEGQPLPGVTIKVDGSSQGAVTDINGEYIIQNVANGSTLSFSFIGMKSKQEKASPSMNVTLQDDFQKLEDVVVIGYGSAKAKDLTSPISVIKAEELKSTPSTTAMTALQGKVAGVNVVSSGTPGSGPTVRIRGAGSFANSSPLYVVDGMFFDDINFLDNNDIQEMSILKDASAAAIYGVRAANGVVIITTKKGMKNQKAKITYDGYVGVQSATNVLKMANSAQYATMLMEANFDAYSPVMKSSIDNYGGSYANGDFHNWTYGSDTNWYDQLLRSALITNNSIGISGGSEKATYSMGISYIHQDGIMDVKNKFDRMNIRASVDYDATSWLKVGISSVMSRSKQFLPNNMAWQQAFNAPGIYPVYDDGNANAFPEKYASPSSIGFTANFFNPVATANYYDSRNSNRQFLTNAYAQLNIIPEKLNFKTNINYNYQSMEGNSFIPTYYVSSWQQQTASSLTKSTTNYDNYIWDNTLTFRDSKGKHNYGAMVGMSMREENYRFLSGTASNVPEGKDEYHYLNKGDSKGVTVSDNGTTYRGLSYFARLNYDYAGKYYVMFTMRADGSSKYQEKWGYFPSVGASWVMSEEPWMKSQHAIDYLKLRASWGQLGNDHVAASDGFANISTGNGASGVYGNTIFPGYQNNSYFSWLQWELVDEINAGFNLSTLQNRLNIDADYFHRMTKHAVISPRLPFSNDVLAGNYGKILNEGFDVSLTWNDRIGKDFKYNIGANLSFLWNTVKDLSGKSIITGGKTVNVVGKEMNSFYGYKVVGVYQTAEEVASDPIAKANGLEPGDFKYEDLNHNGMIDGGDRQTLGAYIPNFTYGLNFGFEWKNLDFTLTTYGQMGAQMYNRKRALRYAQSNYNFDEAQFTDRWTSAGSTNENPSAKALVKGWNVSDQRVNSYFVESADYFRIQNVTLGYMLKNIKLGSYSLPSVRFSLTADRPLTLFTAHAFSPELNDAEGWDTEVYPLTSTYTFGVQIQF